MCKKFISVFEYSERYNGYAIEQMNFWNEDNNRPEIDIEPWHNFRIHTTHECGNGGRVCQVCEIFKQDRIEMPFCEYDCECKRPGDFIMPYDLSYEPELVPGRYTNREYLSIIKRYLDLQRKHACVKIINAVREKYPDRHVIIFDARIVIGNDNCPTDHLNIGIWVFKKPSILKAIEGDHSCRCWDDPQFSGDYKTLEKILQWFALTDFSMLDYEVKRYQEIVDAEIAEEENNGMEYQENDNTINGLNPDISIPHPDRFGHRRLYRELQTEQQFVAGNLRRGRLAQEID